MGLPEFNECCFCIDLKSGAYVLGIFNCVTAIFGIIEFIMFFTSFNGLFLGLACVTGANALAAYAFLMLLRDPNSKEKKETFADYYFYSICIGNACNFVILLCFGLFLYAFIYTGIDILITGYFWLCVRSYAKAHDRMMGQGAGGQVIVVQQQQPMQT